jgi:hypothetical protein
MMQSVRMTLQCPGGFKLPLWHCSVLTFGEGVAATLYHDSLSIYRAVELFDNVSSISLLWFCLINAAESNAKGIPKPSEV